MKVTYFRESSAVYVEANEEIIERLNEYLFPFFEHIENSVTEENIWKIVCKKSESEYSHMELDRIVINQGDQDTEIIVHFSGEKKFIGLIYEYSIAWQVQNVLRFIRVIMRLQSKENGHIFLHGGLVEYKSEGICFIGKKKSGKTSSILSLMKYSDANFISNDDVSLNFSNTEWTGFGWPRSINVRKDTLEKLEIKCPQGLLHPSNSKDMLTNSCFYPKEIVKIFGGTLRSENSIRYMIFPQFAYDKINILEEIPEESAKKLISENIEGIPGKFIEYLVPFFKNEVSFENGAQQIISKGNLKFLSLTQSFDSLEESARKVVRFIEQDRRTDKIKN